MQRQRTPDRKNKRNQAYRPPEETREEGGICRRLANYVGNLFGRKRKVTEGGPDEEPYLGNPGAPFSPMSPGSPWGRPMTLNDLQKKCMRCGHSSANKGHMTICENCLNRHIRMFNQHSIYIF